MYTHFLASSPPESVKWCAYALVLLLPGSFVVVPALWLIKLWRTHLPQRPA